MNAPERPEAVSPLELLHPAGAVGRVHASGGRCPTQLLPRAAERTGADVGLAVVAPSRAELVRRGWLRRALAAAATAVAHDGIVYVLLPPLARGVARRRLRASGLQLAAPLAQLPARAARYLLPIHGPTWRHMLGQEIGANPGVRRGLVAIERLPAGAALLGEWLPGTALVARRPGAPPLAAWLQRLDGDTRPTAYVAAQTSWRGPNGSVVLFCFGAADQRPWGVAKVGPGSAREADRLELLGAEAAEAGARLPRVLARGSAGFHPVLVETAVGGRPAARALEAAPERFGELVSRIAVWLERWSVTTAHRAQLPGAWLEATAARLGLPPAYRQWLSERHAALSGVPAVAAHHDLTMWNVREGDGGAVTVLDWAEAERVALPLGDLFYAVADAAAACDGYRDRVSAARSCFEPTGARAATVAPLVDRATAALGLAPAAAELCFHACWLRHAGNELEAGGAQRPFAELVRWLASRAVGS